jgi:TraK protein
MSRMRISATLAALLLLPLASNAADPSHPPVTLPPTTVAPEVSEDEGASLDRSTVPEALEGAPVAAPSRIPGVPARAAAPSTRSGVLRPLTPLKATQPAASPASTATSPSRIATVSEDGAASITLSSTALNRLVFADPIVAAYTATEAVDIIIEARTAIVSFRAARAVDVMVVTQGGQYLLRLVPEHLAAQTVRVRMPKAESHVTSSYQTQLADLIQDGYRRTPPEGFRTERPNRSLPMTGALAWYLTLQHRGRRLTIQEYAVANTGAMQHTADPVMIAHLFPNARAISTDPEAIPPGAWGRVLVIVDTESLEPPEPSR